MHLKATRRQNLNMLGESLGHIHLQCSLQVNFTTRQRLVLFTHISDDLRTCKTMSGHIRSCPGNLLLSKCNVFLSSTDIYKNMHKWTIAHYTLLWSSGHISRLFTEPECVLAAGWILEEHQLTITQYTNYWSYVVEHQVKYNVLTFNKYCWVSTCTNFNLIWQHVRSKCIATVYVMQS